MSTVALNMIVKDEYEAVVDIIDSASGFFDQINLTVSDIPTANKLQKMVTVPGALHVKYREWNDKFDDARNANMAMCTTDYFFWIDADDTFDFTRIPELVAMADENNLDAIFLPYNYSQDEQGNCITRHWRERLVKMNRGYSWKGWVHETCISDEQVRVHRVNQEVVHHTSGEHILESVDRNHKILEKAFEATHDPRYQHYLGMSYFTHEQYEKCIETLLAYLEVSGSIEDGYRSFCVISEAAYHMKAEALALEYATKAATLKPAYPMAYFLLAQYEADQENWNEALEWVRVGLSKPDPDTLAIFNPTDRERAILVAAQSEFMLGHHNLALAWLRKIPKNVSAQDLYDDFQDEADLETFINLLPKLKKYFTNTSSLWNALSPIAKYDKRLRSLRYAANMPTTWGAKSIVIYCGEGYEEWGPHTLDKGMGGSEEAVVYLAPELAKLGYEVTIYGEVTERMEVNGVVWLPWNQIDSRDNFNIFVSWRNPGYLEKIYAKVKLADIHDVLPEAMMKDFPDVTYLVKTNYHRSLSPHLTDDKFRVIGNGIKKEQFHEA